MKRCAECQFIYEDSDQRCDMDGSVLVHDPRWFEESTSTSPHAKRGRILLLCVVNLVLVTVLAADYYSFSHRNVSSAAAAPAKAKVETPQPITPVISESAAAPGTVISDSSPAQLVAPAELASPAAAAAMDEVVRDNQKATRKTAENPSSKRATTPRAVTKESRPAPKPEPKQKQEDSKVRSMLKKAGHFLKNPFKH